jgi:hypothetical protein
MYTDWVYSNIVVPVHPSTRSLIKLYLIGDSLDDVRLRIKTMELLIDSIKTRDTFPRVNDIKLIWDNTTSDSLLRCFILDVAVKYYNQTYFAQFAAMFPADLVLQIALKSLSEKSVDIDPSFITDASKYLEVEKVD